MPDDKKKYAARITYRCLKCGKTVVVQSKYMGKDEPGKDLLRDHRCDSGAWGKLEIVDVKILEKEGEGE